MLHPNCYQFINDLRIDKWFNTEKKDFNDITKLVELSIFLSTEAFFENVEIFFPEFEIAISWSIFKI